MEHLHNEPIACDRELKTAESVWGSQDSVILNVSGVGYRKAVAVAFIIDFELAPTLFELREMAISRLLQKTVKEVAGFVRVLDWAFRAAALFHRELVFWNQSVRIH